MLSLLRAFNLTTYTPRCYVVAATDAMSVQKAAAFETTGLTGKGVSQDAGSTPASNSEAVQSTARRSSPRRTARRQLILGEPSQPERPITANKSPSSPTSYRVIKIPRSREVGQSFRSSILTTLKALYHALAVVATVRPDVILVNGPGTCIPICGAAVAFRCLGIAEGRVVYVESIARVRRLSLSGKILYHARLADAFFVQWEELVTEYPRARFAGRLM